MTSARTPEAEVADVGIRGAETTGLILRLALAALLLGVGLAWLAVAARFGVVHLTAGETSLVFGPGRNGLSMVMTDGRCPPECGYGVNWRPLASFRPGQAQ
jgi:hypothetical protein